MLITIEKNESVDDLIDALLAVHPMSSILYEVQGDELYFEVVKHEVKA